MTFLREEYNALFLFMLHRFSMHITKNGKYIPFRMKRLTTLIRRRKGNRFLRLREIFPSVTTSFRQFLDKLVQQNLITYYNRYYYISDPEKIQNLIIGKKKQLMKYIFMDKRHECMGHITVDIFHEIDHKFYDFLQDI